MAYCLFDIKHRINGINLEKYIQHTSRNSFRAIGFQLLAK